MSHSIGSSNELRPLLAAIAACAVLAIAGCAIAPKAPAPARTFVPAAWSDLPGWHDDALDRAWPALLAGCRALLASPRTRELWQTICSDATAVGEPDDAAARRFFANHFSPYRIVAADGAASGLVTGYYEPLIDGSRTRNTRYIVPIYAPPDDLLTVDLAALHPEIAGKRVRARLDGRRVVPYWSRAEIDAGKALLEGKAIAYVADPIDAFFLQIQGSGRVRLPDGAMLRLGYADQNGHPYTSIGRVLVERGEMTPETASMQAIRDWGERHRDALPELLDRNASYVFFREVPPPVPGTLEARIDGPNGSLGAPLLAQRAIAVDPSMIPLGAPVWLDTSHPLSGAPLRRLTFAQDTGGAIRGAIRADFFWGHGDEAAQAAGRMREAGSLWILWPKGRPPPS